MIDSLPLVVANLKANNTWEQMSIWLTVVGTSSQARSFAGTIIVCPSSPFLTATSQRIESAHFPLKPGCQDVSKFDQGAYTGEYSASQISGICKYAIVGHSERRKYFAETDEDIVFKVELLIANEITPILCVSDSNQLDSYFKKGKVILKNAGKIVFVYEPPGSISSENKYQPQTPQTADINARLICEKLAQKVVVLYGGSINAENVASFFAESNIDGGLIGQASIEPQKFVQIIFALKRK